MSRITTTQVRTVMAKYRQDLENQRHSQRITMGEDQRSPDVQFRQGQADSYRYAIRQLDQAMAELGIKDCY